MQPRTSTFGPVVLLVAALAVVGCQGSQTTPTASEEGKSGATTPGGGEVVATYTGRTLTSADVQKELARLPAPSRSYLVMPERKRQFVDNMIMNDLLYQEGKQAGYDQDEEVERQVNDLRKRLVVQKVMRKYQTPPTISDEQVRAYYDGHPDLYSTTQIRASHILVKDEPTAKQILAEIHANPERFAELATQKSTDTTTAKRGGDLGMFGQGRMVADFERTAFALKVGEVSEVVKTQYGYHIIKITERKDGERKPFEQVKEQIRATLRNQGLQDQVDGHFAELKRGANVTIDEDALARVVPPPPAAGPERAAPSMGGH